MYLPRMHIALSQYAINGRRPPGVCVRVEIYMYVFVPEYTDRRKVRTKEECVSCVTLTHCVPLVLCACVILREKAGYYETVMLRNVVT